MWAGDPEWRINANPEPAAGFEKRKVRTAGAWGVKSWSKLVVDDRVSWAETDAEAMIGRAGIFFVPGPLSP